MAQRVVFDGRIHTEPTSQARVVGGVNNAAAALSFGNICIIDNGIGAAFGYGKGARTAAGVGRQENDFVYEFDSPQSLRAAVKGGVVWDLVERLFNPASGQQGASKVFLIRAADTDPAAVTMTMADAKTWIFTTKEEGLVCNGANTGATEYKLKKGYAVSLHAGVQDAAKFIFKFWRGTYRGADSNGYLFDGRTEAEAAEYPELLTQSPEIPAANSDVTFRAWAETDVTFQQLFVWSGTSETVTGAALAAADIVSYAENHSGGNGLFAGATETYANSATLDHVLDTIKELDNSIFLALEPWTYAAGAIDTDTALILSHIVNEADFEKHLIIGAGDTPLNFATGATNSTIDGAGVINNELAVVVHGGFEIPYILNPEILVTKSAMYKAAMVAGLMSGLEPQTPLTYKRLRVGNELHQMTKNERVLALEAGVLHMKKNRTLGWVINQGVNSLQTNDYMINNDGSSPEISIVRIKTQLNREIAQAAEVQFIGGNLFTASKTIIEEFVKSTLDNKMMTSTDDGMLVWYGNVKAVRSGTTWNITYDFQANSPINKIFTTGTILDGNIN